MFTYGWNASCATLTSCSVWSLGVTTSGAPHRNHCSLKFLANFPLAVLLGIQAVCSQGQNRRLSHKMS